MEDTNLSFKHYFPERPFRAKETSHQSSNGFALYSVAYLQMTPAVDLHPAAVPKPQEGSPSGDLCQSLLQPLQLLRMDSELNLQSEIR